MIGASQHISWCSAIRDSTLGGTWLRPGDCCPGGSEAAPERWLLDVRRGDGPKECFNYTMASLAVTDDFAPDRAAIAAEMVAAMNDTHAALKADDPSSPA